MRSGEGLNGLKSTEGGWLRRCWLRPYNEKEKDTERVEGRGSFIFDQCG